MHLVNSGQKTAADAARLFNVHPATVSRLLQSAQGILTGFYVPLLPKPHYDLQAGYSESARAWISMPQGPSKT